MRSSGSAKGAVLLDVCNITSRSVITLNVLVKLLSTASMDSDEGFLIYKYLRYLRYGQAEDSLRAVGVGGDTTSPIPRFVSAVGSVELCTIANAASYYVQWTGWGQSLNTDLLEQSWC